MIDSWISNFLLIWNAIAKVVFQNSIPVHSHSYFTPFPTPKFIHPCYSTLLSHSLPSDTYRVPPFQFVIFQMQIDYHITNLDRSKPMEANEKVGAGLERNAQIKAIDWNCDGTLLAFGGKDKTITIWNPKHTTVLLFGWFES